MSEFKNKVIQIVREIPYGTVASYGQIASYAGAPRAARQVGWILNQLEDKILVPWWRIVNNAGRISIKGCRYNTPQIMKQLLESEGVVVKDDLTFDIEQYRYHATDDDLVRWRLDERYIELIDANYLKLQ